MNSIRFISKYSFATNFILLKLSLILKLFTAHLSFQHPSINKMSLNLSSIFKQDLSLSIGLIVFDLSLIRGLIAVINGHCCTHTFDYNTKVLFEEYQSFIKFILKILFLEPFFFSSLGSSSFDVLVSFMGDLFLEG